MRASRMLTLLTHLQVHGQASGPDLARRLEVSQRTVQRDVESLVAAGIPIRSTRGPNGGYRLPGGYRTRLTGLVAAEAHALSFLGLPGPAGELGLGHLLDAARTKVWAALTCDARDQAERAAQRFHLDPVRWFGTAEPAPLLTTLADALWRDRRIRLRHARGGDDERPPLDPLGLVLAAGDWYLVANRDRELRTYRVSRVTGVDVLDEECERPAGFRLSRTWAAARRAWETSHAGVDVRVRVRSDALGRLRRAVAVAGQDRVPVAAADGWVELSVPFDGEAWARTTLLGLGSAVEVLGPAGLREAIAAELSAAARRYALPCSRASER